MDLLALPYFAHPEATEKDVQDDSAFPISAKTCNAIGQRCLSFVPTRNLSLIAYANG